MKKLYRQIRMLSVVAIFIIFSFIIHSYFTVTVSSLGKRRYRSIGNHKYLWNRLLGRNMETCLRQKRRFWSKVLKDFIDNSSWNCLRRDKNKTGLFSYFVMENFEDISCLNKTIQLSKTDMPQIALVSYPGSGDTFYRHLIEAVSGIATGSKHCSHRGRDVFIGECSKDTSKTIVVNTHQLADSSKRTSTFEKVILIHRNPYELIIDTFSKIMNTSTAERTLIKSKEWTKFVIKTSKDWRDHTLSWLSVWKGPLYISYYEKMKSDHYAELNHLVRFMGINATVRDLWCVGDSLKYFKGENPVRLQHSVVYMYTDQLRKIVQRDLETVQRAINKGKEL